ncbi:predicted protein [Sclerotinia sclerotiorum 1980 UF-70]|uniref:Uncharacterized protein n=1 Tax=Sclerotinia sclerotiorum (strain ATCC 18683 / 1980 / Ss-1) TaxID=665079 RepID=A7F753_SCLS1|nr:predicted protein [Sclerotinia sclerotiorum 1980 UF-70]EDN98574.1 predicted protein [Sclerotinia sclerotiorum 1980 UF-70]
MSVNIIVWECYREKIQNSLFLVPADYMMEKGHYDTPNIKR